ncbi:hypothetical protein GCM10009751_30650 [Myceligenerans crystallogenes]|uniref:Uncharacterized protein n=1 Tax=Myceligenerans crystallogenes TaxID=316335 RepID=A0ABP4ZS08_9MICO
MNSGGFGEISRAFVNASANASTIGTIRKTRNRASAGLIIQAAAVASPARARVRRGADRGPPDTGAGGGFKVVDAMR